AILKGSLIRYITAGNEYKLINLLLKYINASYVLNIKFNKNSTYDIYTIFSRLAFNSTLLVAIRKFIKSLFRSKVKG
ncbi:hypothetical protein QBC39DRAFT_261345, partial [Podospora conica]